MIQIYEAKYLGNFDFSEKATKWCVYHSGEQKRMRKMIFHVFPVLTFTKGTSENSSLYFRKLKFCWSCELKQEILIIEITRFYVLFLKLRGYSDDKYLLLHSFLVKKCPLAS